MGRSYTIHVMAKILVTGGAGYIGSMTVRSLIDAGHSVTVFDNLSSGHTQALPDSVPVVQGDIADGGKITDLIRSEGFEALVHFAAFIEAGESMTNPRRFYENNVVGGLRLANAVLDAADGESSNAIPIVFSSTAAVYGMPKSTPIAEAADKEPVNVYGETKLAVERVLQSYSNAYGLRSISLRYFNACGADPSGELGEDHSPESHLIPNALKAAIEERAMKIFGSDYETSDGTCVRDYIHVADLASAHVLAVEALLAGATTNVYNIGLGSGFTVLEVLDAIDSVTGVPLQREFLDRRPGDPAVLVADSSRLKSELGWSPRFTSLTDIVATAWEWHRKYPNGFADKA